MALIYDNEYNNKIATSLNNLTKLKEYNNQPTKFNYSGGSMNMNEKYDRVIGGMVPITSVNRLDKPVFFQKPSSGSEYIQPGSNSNYPMYNSIELDNINGGAKSGGSFLSSALSSAASFVKPLIKPAISKGLDLAVPIIVKPLVKDITGSEKVGDIASDAARFVTGSLSGYGAISAGVGDYEKKTGGKIRKPKKSKLDELTKVMENIQMGEPIDIKKIKRIKKPKTETIKAPKKIKTEIIKSPNDSQPKKNIKTRMELVKKIMKEKGMNLPSASKYIKENGLY